jgi:hypothetical protein
MRNSARVTSLFFCQGVVWRPAEFLLAFVANCTTIGQIMVDVARV